MDLTQKQQVRSVLYSGDAIAFRMQGWRRTVLVRCKSRHLAGGVSEALQKFLPGNPQVWTETSSFFDSANRQQFVRMDVRSLIAFNLWVKFLSHEYQSKKAKEAEPAET